MKKRDGFASSLGFVLAAAGSAIGLGNLWGFPYKTAKCGGAVFVFLYCACVLLIGLVTMLAEMYLGRRSRANPVAAYKTVDQKLGAFGLLAILVPLMVLFYYSVLGGWTVKYTVHSFFGNTGILSTFSVNTWEVIVCTGVFLLLGTLIILGGVKDGIEKVSKVLMPILFVILVGVSVYALTLGEGVSKGLEFYLKPDFSRVSFSDVLTAMGQAFCSLSLGMGIMITYGSYSGESLNLGRSCVMVCLFDTLVALLAGLAIFPAVAHFDPTLLESSEGIVLMFSILPQVFDSMGLVGRFLSFAFFGMVAIAAITSVISLIEVATQFLIQRFGMNRKSAAGIVSGICLAASVPVGISLGRVGILGESTPAAFGLDYLTFLDKVTNTMLMPICALVACITVGWFIKPKNAFSEMERLGTSLPAKLRGILSVMLRFVTPALILIVEVGGVYSEVKSGNLGVVMTALGLILLCAVVYALFLRKQDPEIKEETDA